MSTLPTHEIYAIKYGHHNRKAADNFIGGDPHDAPMPIDYFVWVVQGQGRTWVVDTGFAQDEAKKRDRHIERDVGDALRLVGVDPANVEDVIITHFHYDHAGNHDLFPKARYHVQDREMQYATGRCMCMPALRVPFSAADVMRMVERVYQDRVVFHDGDEEIAQGLSVHHVGGHTAGLQMVRVWTQRGWVVLASDAAHLYANMEQGRPFPIVYNVFDMLAGHRRAYALAASPKHVIPGHDPLVLKRYPAPKAELKGIVARLDVEPVGA
jgi:glyoxylase-like metal-dependent hydrolase (beta-lactamase superfamily II)